MDHADRVLELLNSIGYVPLTLKAMSRRFQLADLEYPDLRSAIKRLIREGKLELAKDKTLRLPDTKGTIRGIYRRSQKGFGFVRPHLSTDRSEQIYIPADEGRDASSGDEVLVKVVKRPKKSGMNIEGKVLQVLNRAAGLFVGTYLERDGAGFVRIDGTTFTTPIYVGDPGAKGAKTDDKVALEMVRYPSPTHQGEGVITELLGPRGTPGVDTLSVIRALGIPDVFDDDTLQEAREQALTFKEENVDDRLDLREVLTVTIDPATARDFDDAISLSRDDRGYWSLGVHIADVSHFVKIGSALDIEAKKRGTSVYLPDRVIPMLPEVISNSLASLQSGHVRYTMSALLEFNAEGIRTGMTFARSAIKVDQRFSYEQAFEAMQPSEGIPAGLLPEVHATLGRMLELAMILRKRRFLRGALELSMPEIEIDLGDVGQVVGAHLASHDVSHQVIEEFMLAANESVADWLGSKEVAILRRVHPDPEPGKLEDFAEFARELGFEIEQAQSRFELQKVLAEAVGKPEAHAIHYALLRSLKQARYTPEKLGHYALASDDYCHFTSPIRRFPDLQVHRQLAAVLAGKKPKTDLEELTALGEHCTRTERRAETAERELIKIKLLTHLLGRIGETFHAVIINVTDFGFFARLVELPVEGLLHLTALSDDYYYLESETHTLIGRRGGKRYRLGDQIEVKVASIDVDRRELDLVLATSDPSQGPATGPHPSRSQPIRRAPRPTERVVNRGPKKGKGKGKSKGKKKGR